MCRTDLHLIDGELPDPRLPVIPWPRDRRAAAVGEGSRVSPPASASACPGWLDLRPPPLLHQRPREPVRRGPLHRLPDRRRLRRIHLADARYCFPLADAAVQAAEQALLLCAGLIGYRALRLAGGAERVGIYGFGAAAHIVAQVVVHQGHRFYAFTRPGTWTARPSPASLGAAWAGEAGQAPPEALDAAIIFAPPARWCRRPQAARKRAGGWSAPAST